MRRAVFLTALAAFGHTCAISLPADAQDLFDTVVYELAVGYGGSSTVRASDLHKKYLPEIKKLCAAKQNCEPEKAYPIISKLVKDIGDAHTNFFTRKEIEDISKMFMGEATSYKSFGMITEALGSGGRVVVEVLPNSAASEKGLQVGDLLVKVGSVKLNGAEGLKAISRASKRSSASFEILRQGKTMKLSMTAKQMVIPATTLNIKANVPILRLRHFNYAGIGQEIHDAVRVIKKQKSEGLILDLRYNSGGLVTEYLLAAAAFTEPEPLLLQARLINQTISYSDGKYSVNGVPEETSALQSPVLYDGPMAVIVDKDTASAGEFLARALLSRPCTTIIGEPTAGVADTATRFINLPDGSALQLTFARLLGADGQKVDSNVKPQQKSIMNMQSLVKTGRDQQIDFASSVLKKMPADCLSGK